MQTTEAELIKQLRRDVAELSLENDSLRRHLNDAEEQNRMLLSDIGEMRRIEPLEPVMSEAELNKRLNPFPAGRWSTL